MLFVLNLWNLVCTSYLQHLSPWTSLLSSPQQPHTANGYWTGQHSSGRQVWPAHPCAPLPVHAALLPLYTQSFKNPFSPCRAQREPCSYWKVLSDHFRSLCSHQILHNYFSQLSGRTLEYLSSYCLQQLFPPPIFFVIIYCFIFMEQLPSWTARSSKGWKHFKFSTVASPIPATWYSNIWRLI